MNILIIGCNGFIGSHLSEYIISNTEWNITGIDLDSDRIEAVTNNPRFRFINSDITTELDLLTNEISKSDVVLPLAAIATPKKYITNPIQVFELDFEANLFIIRQCLKFNKRLIFPSTSEVYGLCEDEYFDEQNSNLILGPIKKSRWIYSCSKQLLDRVIWAYKDEGLDFTIFRPFNWIGPNLDSVHSKSGDSRVITQFIGNIIRKESIELVDGGMQKRSFTDIRDGIDALVKIIENKEKVNHKIINIGFPENEFSIKELASILITKFKDTNTINHMVEDIDVKCSLSEEYYGEGYQDVSRRVPNIEKIKNILGWSPKLTLQDSISHIVDFHISNKDLHQVQPYEEESKQKLFASR